MTYREVLEKRTGLKLKEAKQYEVGKKYYCSYWQLTLEVLSIKSHDIYGEVYECLWSTGTRNINSTRLDTLNDFEIVEG